MPLSEHEQQLLQQMERALYAEDPKFASQMRGADPRLHHRRRALLGVAGFVVGVVLLFTGLVVTQVPVSVLGFVVMLVSVFFAVSSWRQMPAAETPGAPPAGAGNVTPIRSAGRRSKRPKAKFMDRVEERWRRRRDERGH